MELSSQFRCNGSNGYLAFLDNILQIRETANATLEGIDYDFKVFSDPNELLETIKTKNAVNNKSRMVAGYCRRMSFSSFDFFWEKINQIFWATTFRLAS